MKSKVITINKTLIFTCILCSIFLVFVFILCIDQTDTISFQTKTINSKAININQNTTSQNEIQIKNNINNVIKEYENFPKEYKGYKTVGKIKIPKLEIEKYILNETNEQSLKVAVTKVCGPKANEIGNLCISGHNYNQTFGRLKELEIGDKIIITDTYSREVIYQVYKTYKVNPNDTQCLNQETNGEREITLITCTLGAIKRNIVKAIEVYD